MKKLFLFFVTVSVSLLLSGCRTTDPIVGKIVKSKGSGSLGNFIIMKVFEYSTPESADIGTVSIPTGQLKGSWDCAEDDFGIVIQSKEFTSEEVEEFIVSIYGEPPSYISDLMPGTFLIPAKVSGAAISVYKDFSKDNEEVTTIIINKTPSAWR